MIYRVTVSSDRMTVFSAVDFAATKSEIPWFLCGAYSRILLCEEVWKIPAGRATYDLDIAICVESLKVYTQFRADLCKTYNFKQHRNTEHRLIHSSGISVDIIPFGKFAEPDELYKWGTDRAFTMNVPGFSDARSSTISFLLNDKLEIESAGYAAQFVLKLFAWHDRRSSKGIDDASDLAYFLVNALKSIPDKDIYNKYDSVLQETGYDTELASCYALGRQIRSAFSWKTVSRVVEILRNELQAGEDSALVSDLFDRFSSWRQPDERISAIINQVIKGIS
ncbi:MAG: hypothetical protein B1H09_03830 [Gemmatimonadaceae bacterium 4484_173]|nr:MAG: hypothetical protein B1H09_03830 [Gemmatimonadaceae bacterium 4484_173]RKZ02507.1 MAG: hypothetical protein DRQ21_08500 [Candidatus Fermentibacteria bacterium]